MRVKLSSAREVVRGVYKHGQRGWRRHLAALVRAMDSVSETTVHRIGWDVDPYQTLLYDLADVDQSLWLFNGLSKASTWTPQPVYVERPRKERPDIWHLFGAAVLVMSPETVELLEPYISKAGELLPLTLSGTDETLMALNILEDIDCTDPDAYSLETLEFPPVFLEHRLPESGLFKIPPIDNVTIFHVERDDDDDSFRKRIEHNGLKGITFERVWSNVRGPEPVNLLTS